MCLKRGVHSYVGKRRGLVVHGLLLSLYEVHPLLRCRLILLVLFSSSQPMKGAWVAAHDASSICESRRVQWTMNTSEPSITKAVVHRYNPQHGTLANHRNQRSCGLLYQYWCSITISFIGKTKRLFGVFGIAFPRTSLRCKVIQRFMRMSWLSHCSALWEYGLGPGKGILCGSLASLAPGFIIEERLRSFVEIAHRFLR